MVEDAVHHGNRGAKAAGHIVYRVRKQREVIAGAPPFFQPKTPARAMAPPIFNVNILLGCRYSVVVSGALGVVQIVSLSFQLALLAGIVVLAFHLVCVTVTTTMWELRANKYWLLHCYIIHYIINVIASAYLYT